MSEDFQSIVNNLGNGILAAYLLGYDEARTENQAKLKLANFSETYAYISFANGEKSAQRVGNDKAYLDLRFDVPPVEAIDYFKRKKVVTKTEFEKLDRQAKSAAFTVGGIYQQDILEAFKQEITNALETGQTQKYVINQFKEILDGAGHKELGDFHLETIVRSNMMTAYGVGRRKQLEETSDLLPFWQRNAVGDNRTRPKHRALDGIIYPANHEFWDDHFCPDDFNCRCSIIALLDYPNDYDHSHPNPETTIAYDNKGLPAKAEYLTQVVDLKATDFVGVPKTASLEKVITDNAVQAQATKKRNRDTYKTPQSVIDKALEIRNEKVEVAHFFDTKGDLLFTGRGTADEFDIDLPDEIAEKYFGGIDLHNHPSDGFRDYESFSLTDVLTAIDWNITESLVVTKKYLYSMRPPKSGWIDSLKQKIEDAYWKYEAEITKDFFESFRSGEMSRGEIQDQVRDRIWKKVAKQFALRYKRRKV